MGQEQLPQTRDKLNYKQREHIFDKVYKLVTKHYFDPKFNGTDWPTIAQSCRQEIVAVDEPDAFETAMHGLLRRLGTSHTGFFHQSGPARSCAAGCRSIIQPQRNRWRRALGRVRRSRWRPRRAGGTEAG